MSGDWLTQLAKRRTEEIAELLDEVKALEKELTAARVARDLMIGLAERCQRQRAAYDKGLSAAWERIDELSAENAQWRARVTLGGIPPVSGAPHWQNVAAPPVPSASDESAPPLRRSDTSSSFRGGESGG